MHKKRGQQVAVMGDIKKHLTNHSSNEMIREAIRSIALKGIVNKQTGVVRGTSKVTGFVAKIHKDESDELFGTIDVQEYADWSVSETDDAKFGYHEGVLLTAIQKDNQGYVIIPKLYSDVIVSKDPDSNNEYVTMFSHVDLIQLDSHEKISIGVREREEYKADDENSPDVHELELTGVYTNTTYEKDTILTTIQGESEENIVSQTIDSAQIKQVVGEDKTSSTMTQDGLNVKHDKTTLDLTDDEATLAQGKSKVMVTDGVVYVGSDSGTDDAVLGQQLATILSDLVGYLGQMMTPTMMGPQPPANVLASFISLKAKIQSFASSHSGFLTKKVQIQK